MVIVLAGNKADMAGDNRAVTKEVRGRVPNSDQHSPENQIRYRVNRKMIRTLSKFVETTGI